jgi:hypothetical protein
MPEIFAEGDGVVFRFDVPNVSTTARLVIRCDADGNAWVSISHSGSAGR